MRLNTHYLEIAPEGVMLLLPLVLQRTRGFFMSQVEGKSVGKYTSDSHLFFWLSITRKYTQHYRGNIVTDQSTYDFDVAAPSADEAFKPTFLIHTTYGDNTTISEVSKFSSEGEAKAAAQKILENNEHVLTVQVFTALPGKSIARRVTRVEFTS